ncbi:Gfo/Idh/MocA family oxidoreductase [Runella sp.]|uniref:Gfo/Idh/MocA family protein n=1 Tax=Runella sp. TaxID=1960881 RepID=UPI0030171CF2
MVDYEDDGHHDKKTGKIMTIGLIGCGIWGKTILRELISLNIDAKVFDPHPIIKTELADTYPQFSANSLDELKSTDGIILASPSATHRPVLEQIIPWNLPIFVEKPLTTSLEDAKALQQIAHDHLFMMHIWRYHAGIQLLGEIARTQKIGSITALYTSRCNWTSPRTDTDSVWNLAPHDLTIAIEILGAIPTPKAVSIEWHNGIARGMTALLGDNPFVQIEVSNRSVTKRREVRLHGTKGIAVLADEKVDYIDIFYGDDHSYPSPIRQERLYFDSTPPLKREMMAFVDFLNGGPTPISSFQEGLYTIDLLSQLHEMAK